MEGVGARLGRSSSRYGTTTVFTGPVRKWKKNWVPITPPPSSSSNHNVHNSNHHNHSNGSINGSSNGAVSHLRLYKWTPLSKDSINNNNSSSPNNSKIKRSPSHVNNNDSDGPVNDEDALPEEPPRRKFKYIPVAVLEDQKKEEEISEDEAKPIDANEENGENVSKSDDFDEKPDINDMPMEENQDSEENQNAPPRQDLNELDLSLGLTSHDEELDSDSETEPNEDAQPDRAKVGSAGV